MKKKVIWLSLSFMLVTAMLLASCAKSTTSTSTSTTQTTITTKTTTTTTTTKTTTPPISVTTTTTAAGNWWDSLPQPQYGGTLTLRCGADFLLWDPYYAAGQAGILTSWLEPLFSYNWTLQYDYKFDFTPPDYKTGQLAKSWEMPDKNTVIVHLRTGIHWQNISPASGRLLTADDIAWNFNRIYGLGGYGFTKPAPPSATNAVQVWLDMTSCVADNTANTVTFKFKGDSQESILEGLTGSYQKTVCPDAVKLWGDVNDWHHAIGTGPFILTDFVSGSSAALKANPDYWGHDERYPQNQLPYVAGVRWIIVPDAATALAGLRTGKIDVLEGLSLTDKKNLQKTNPELLSVTNFSYAGDSIDINNAASPYNDVRVRQALQMAINLPDIAANYFGGTVSPSPCALTSDLLYPAYGFPYSQWPQDLKDEYAYNPTQAKALLAAAGKSNFTATVLCDNTADIPLLEIVKGNWADIGVTMNIQRVDHGSFLGAAFSHKVTELAYKTPSSLALAYSPILQIQNFHTGMLFNWEMVSNPAYDALVDDALSVTSTIDDIKRDLAEANRITAKGHYCIALVNPVNFGIYQPWLHSYAAQFNGISGAITAGESNYFWQARFWIDTKMKTSMGHSE